MLTTMLPCCRRLVERLHFQPTSSIGGACTRAKGIQTISSIFISSKQGRWIQDHGVVHNMYFNTTTLLKLPHKITLSESKWWDDGTLPLWITAQHQGKKVASFHYPGGNVTYGGEALYRSLGESLIHPDANETEWRINIDIVMEWFEKEDFDFVTLYYGEPDHIGHKTGPETQERRDIIRQIDRTIGYLIDNIERHNLKEKLNVIITSDHGMTTIKKAPEVNEIRLSKFIDFKNIKLELLDYGGFGMLLPKEGKTEEVYQALKNAHPHLKVYKKEEFPERFHYSKNDRVLPILVYGDLGYNVNGRIILYINKGDHGFDNKEMDMKMIFRAFGPDFKSAYLSEPFDSVHIYPLMCKLIGVKPEPNNGSLMYTDGMLVDSFENGLEKPEEPRTSDHPSSVIALSAVLTFLVLIAIILVTYNAVKRNKRSKQGNPAQHTNACETSATPF
ncbi:ectonucleotide pyrophosphatase/phosphodiesterase family member 7 isoform X2 [Scyliorhinus canicula]|uniref:ectonucleotide pyrophosphatase/phosphodiesterase family member 7 isoform X2 n=1 Tax=Scyliorhinus canicula TaxID=7830 RepID=UPI0018F632DB|nr:ectonucleotide pyrophosphatase/phosphodiesterase family member 7 isoform X2 [Scyliorhinus canicula]